MSKQNKSSSPRRFPIARLFQSNRFVLVFSLFVALVLWFIMAFQNTETRARYIDNIPISVSLSESMLDEGYEIFELSDHMARVSVTGNNITVNQLTADDILVTAPQATSITRTGSYTLNLEADKVGNLTDYQFDTISPGSVIAYVDKRAEKTLKVETDIQYHVAEGYYATQPILQHAKLTITGPESEVSKITKVMVSHAIEAPLSAPTSFQVKYQFYDRDGAEITDVKRLSLSSTEEEVQIDVLKEVTLPVEPVIRNVPEGLNIDALATVTPKQLQIGIPEGNVVPEQIPLKAIDLSTIDPENNKVTTEFEMPEHCTNISGSKSATVYFGIQNYSTKTFTITEHFRTNLHQGSAKVVTNQLTVTMVGPESKLEELQTSDLEVIADLSGIQSDTGSMEVPATISVDGKYGCWAYGAYTVVVNVTSES